MAVSGNGGNQGAPGQPRDTMSRYPARNGQSQLQNYKQSLRGTYGPGGIQNQIGVVPPPGLSGDRSAAIQQRMQRRFGGGGMMTGDQGLEQIPNGQITDPGQIAGIVGSASPIGKGMENLNRLRNGGFTDPARQAAVQARMTNRFGINDGGNIDPGGVRPMPMPTPWRGPYGDDRDDPAMRFRRPPPYGGPFQTLPGTSPGGGMIPGQPPGGGIYQPMPMPNPRFPGGGIYNPPTPIPPGQTSPGQPPGGKTAQPPGGPVKTGPMPMPNPGGGGFPGPWGGYPGGGRFPGGFGGPGGWGRYPGGGPWGAPVQFGPWGGGGISYKPFTNTTDQQGIPQNAQGA